MNLPNGHLDYLVGVQYTPIRILIRNPPHSEPCVGHSEPCVGHREPRVGHRENHEWDRDNHEWDTENHE